MMTQANLNPKQHVHFKTVSISKILHLFAPINIFCFFLLQFKNLMIETGFSSPVPVDPSVKMFFPPSPPSQQIYPSLSVADNTATDLNTQTSCEWMFFFTFQFIDDL